MSKVSLESALSRILAVSALAIMFTLVSGSASRADWDDCPSGNYCLWKDAGYVTNGNDTGYFKFEYYYSNFTSAYYAVPQIISVNDSASSVRNNGNTYSAGIFQHKDAGGWVYILQKKTNQNNLTEVGKNDAASSGYFCNWTTAC